MAVITCAINEPYTAALMCSMITHGYPEIRLSLMRLNIANKINENAKRPTGIAKYKKRTIKPFNAQALIPFE